MENFDQLSSLLSPILNDPEALGSIMDAARQMGLDSALGDLAGPANEKQQQSPEPPKNSGSLGGNISSDLLGMVAKIAPVLESATREDDTSRLLSALQPFLKGEREQRLENAKKMLSVMRVMSALRESSQKL